MIGELKRFRIEARKLAKSGHPGVRAEAKGALRKIEDDIAYLRARMGKAGEQ